MPKPDVSDQRKPQILSAAAQLFGEHGIHASSMNEISKAANLSKAAVYHYYDSKEAMVEALIRQLFDDDQPELQRLVDGEGPAIERIQNYVDGLVRLLERNKQLYPVLAEFKAIAPRNRDVQQVIKPCFQRYVGSFETLIAQGIETGEIQDDVEAAEAAWTLAAIIEGGMTLRNTTGRSLKKIVVPGVRLFLKGISK